MTTVAEAVAEKKALESTILQAIRAFEDHTGLEVLAVRLALRHEMDGNSHVYGLSLEVGLS